MKGELLGINIKVLKIFLESVTHNGIILGDVDSILTKFSMYYNSEKLLKINGNSPNRIDVLDGLRAISMIWIIAGHGFSSWIDRFPASNQNDIPKVGNFYFRKKFYFNFRIFFSSKR